MQADPAQWRRTHPNDLAGQIITSPCDTSALEDGGSLWVTLPAYQGWERLDVKG